jgi:hypothetical protein
MIIRKYNNELRGVIGLMTCHKGKAGYKTVIFSSQYSKASGKPMVDHSSFNSLAAIPEVGLMKTSDMFQCTIDKRQLNVGQCVPIHGGSLTPVS